MKFNSSFALVASTFAFGSMLGCTGRSLAAPPLVMGYYPDYRLVPGPADIRFDRFTHVIHSFVRADTDGKMMVSKEILDPTLVNAAHAKGVKVLLALGGGASGKSFGEMVRDPQKNAQFIADVTKLMVDTRSDGLAIDWEQPTAEDKPLTTSFVANLRAATKAAKPDSQLVLVVNAKPNNSKGYDGLKLRDYVDYLQVMTYDFHGPWSHSGHHTPLYESKGDAIDGKVLSFQASLDYWHKVQGFRTDQILLGIAAYGRGFKVKDWNEKPIEKSQYPEIAYKDILPLIGKGWSRQWDSEAHAPWLVNDDNTDRISYDDEQSVADKAVWMKAQGLPGYFTWELSQDYIGSDNTLIAAATKAWNGAPETNQ